MLSPFIPEVEVLTETPWSDPGSMSEKQVRELRKELF
jgi:hypothetical protein